MTGRIFFGLAVIGICFFIPVNSNAVNFARADIQGTSTPIGGTAMDGTDNILTRPFAKVSMFINNYPANRFIQTKSPSSFTPSDVFAGPYKLLSTRPETSSSFLEVYGMLLASLGLMGLIAHRRLTYENE
jgi:hypothetical protein